MVIYEHFIKFNNLIGSTKLNFMLFENEKNYRAS